MITPELNSVTNGTAQPAASQAPVLGKDDFLHLLITQLQKITVGGDFFSKQRNRLGIVSRCLKIL